MSAARAARRAQARALARRPPSDVRRLSEQLGELATLERMATWLETHADGITPDDARQVGRDLRRLWSSASGRYLRQSGEREPSTPA